MHTKKKRRRWYAPFTFSRNRARKFHDALVAGDRIAPPAPGWTEEAQLQLAGVCLANCVSARLNRPETLEAVRQRMSVKGDLIPNQHMQAFIAASVADMAAVVLVVAHLTAQGLSDSSGAVSRWDGGARMVNAVLVEYHRSQQGDEKLYRL